MIVKINKEINRTSGFKETNKVKWKDWSLDISKKSFRDQEKEQFFSELFTLTKSGIDLHTALNLIASEQKDEKMLKAMNSINDSIISGSSLSEALEKTNMFTPYEYYNIKVGEENGILCTIFFNLKDYYKKKIKLRRNIINAISYPIVILCVAILVLIFMLKVLIPMFEDIFNRFQGEMPSITQFVINLSKGFSKHFLLFFLFSLSITVFVFVSKNQEWFKKKWSNILLKTPILGNFVKKIYLASFFQSMAMLIASKTPLTTALNFESLIIDFYPLEQIIKKLECDIFSGSSFSDSLSKHAFFDKKVIVLIKIGESVNELDRIFSELSEQYTEEIDNQTAVINNFLEPIMIIIIGGIVAIILIAMYLPIFQIGTSLFN